MGSAEPRSFSRGKRGVAGKLVFTVFNRDALLDAMEDKLTAKTGVQKFIAERNADGDANFINIEDWDSEMTNLAGVGDKTGKSVGDTKSLVKRYKAIYADEILPFDITISFANEYGQRAVLTLYGVELLNEASGFSIDNVTSEKAYTFVARRVGSMRALDDDNKQGFSSTY